MSASDDLVAFIRARLDDDAEAAQWVPKDRSGPWWHEALPAKPYDPVRDLVVSSGGPIAEVDEEVPTAVAHIARHDPARVLRGVEAKRRMLNLAVTVLESGYTDSADAKMVARDTIRNLASEWPDHEDYRDEWKP